MGRLAAAVYVEDPVTRQRIILQPGDEPSPALAELITHPDAWDTDIPAPGDPDTPEGEQPDAPPSGPPEADEQAKPDGVLPGEPDSQEAPVRKPSRRKPAAE